MEIELDGIGRQLTANSDSDDDIRFELDNSLFACIGQSRRQQKWHAFAEGSKRGLIARKRAQIKIDL